MSKYIDMIGWKDTPHLSPPNISQDELEGATEGMLPHEIEARTTGMPSLGRGAVYPVAEERLFCEAFKIPEHWPRGWAMDVGWVRTAGLVGAYDEDNEKYYLTGEYYVGEAKPIEHVHGLKAMLPWPNLDGQIDPAAEHSNIKDGTKLKQEYEALGLRLVLANNAVAAGIHRCLTLMQGGQLSIFEHLTNLRTEKRLYRRNEKGKIIKENDHLMDCMRYLLNTPGAFKTRPIQRAHRAAKGEW
jgi:hypothetical protein